MNSNIRYKLYVFDVSYYSGKVECYFRYKKIPYERIEPNWNMMINVIYKNTGSMKVPAVYDNEDNVWYKDSTTIIEHLESVYSDRGPSILPFRPIDKFYAI